MQIPQTEKNEPIAADAVSIESGTTLGKPNTTLPFHAVKVLDIVAEGIPVLRLPTPSPELQINVLNEDGSLAYQSTRALRCSGNCVLTEAEGRELVATEYFFGPSKDPVLHVLGKEGMEGKVMDIRTTSKWTSRMHTFVLPDGGTFTWEYKKEQGFGDKGKAGVALILTLQEKRVAALIRNEETRTPDTKASDAGNGGRLLLSEAVGTADGINEEIVVASCLLMLKKEIDRRRGVQIGVIATAV